MKQPTTDLLPVRTLRAVCRAPTTLEGPCTGLQGTKAVKLAQLLLTKEESEAWIQEHIRDSWSQQKTPQRGAGFWVADQHFVPKMYLKEWVPVDRKLVLARFRTEAGCQPEELQWRNPANLCVVRELYDQKFEQWMALFFESKVAQVLRELKKGDPPSAKMLCWLVAFAANLVVRNVSQRDRHFRKQGSKKDWQEMLLERDMLSVLSFLMSQRWALVKVARDLPTSDCPVVAVKADTVGQGVVSVDLVELASLANTGKGATAEPGMLVLLPILPQYVLMCEIGKLKTELGARTVVDLIVGNSWEVVVGSVALKTLARLKPRIKCNKTELQEIRREKNRLTRKRKALKKQESKQASGHTGSTGPTTRGSGASAPIDPALTNTGQTVSGDMNWGLCPLMGICSW